MLVTLRGRQTRIACGERLDVPGHLSVPAALVLNAYVDGSRLVLRALAPRGRRRVVSDAQWRARASESLGPLALVALDADIAPADVPYAEVECARLLAHAYPRAARGRRILVVCNPAGGRGKGLQQLERHVAPILAAAGCAADIRKTERRLHARDMGRDVDLAQFDALVCVGGDGTVHELINGIAARADAAEALRTPLVPVPSGSGNGLYVSLFGAAQGFSAPLACLAAIKGAAVAHRLCALTQPRALFEHWPSTPYAGGGADYVQYYAFLSQAIGLIADVDLGTEHWRCIGDLRFTLAYVLGALRDRACAVDVDVLVGDAGSVDAKEMSAAPRGGSGSGSGSGAAGAAATHPTHLRHGTVLSPIKATATLDPKRPHVLAGWQRLDCAVSSLYTGKLPFVARTLMAFPYASSGDAAVDVLVQHAGSGPMQMLRAIEQGERGHHIFTPSISYFKAEAVRITPRPATRGPHYLSIDGEAVPYGPVQIEIAPLCMHVLSLDDGAAAGVGMYARPAPRD